MHDIGDEVTTHRQEKHPIPHNLWICCKGFLPCYCPILLLHALDFYYGKLYLFQNIFLWRKPYLLLCFLQLGVGSFIAHYFSTIVNSLLVTFGLSEELHNPVSIYFNDTVNMELYYYALGNILYDCLALC